MAVGVKTRVKLPTSAKRGEIVTIKTQVTHPMENGFRRDGEGKLIPRSIIHRFICNYEGKTVVDFDMGPSISTNPYFKFDIKLPKDSPPNGIFEFAWYDDDGSIYRETKSILVV